MSPNPILKDCVIAIADNLGGSAWPVEKVQRLVNYWGGQFSHAADDNVTHLLCTRGDSEENISAVRATLRNKNTEIVICDWLVDSISKGARLKTQAYRLDGQAADGKADGKAEGQEFHTAERRSDDLDNYVDKRLWHVYQDSTSFEYQVRLTRSSKGGGNDGEKHLLTIWESNTKPHNYQCTTLFTKNSKNKAVHHHLRDEPVDLNTAIKIFKQYFQKKTSIAWDERIKKAGTADPVHFQYQPPVGGEPVGLVKSQRASILNKNSKRSKTSKSNEKEKPRFTETIEAYFARHTRHGEEQGANHSKQPPAKKPQHDQATRPKAGGIKEIIVIDSDSEPETKQPEAEAESNLPEHEPADSDEPRNETDDSSSDGYSDYGPDVSREAIREAHAIAENILEESNRGILRVRNNQAFLIDAVRRERAEELAHALRMREIEAAEDALEAEESNSSSSDY